MQELINLAGKVRGNLVLLHGIYRVDIPVSNVRCGTNSCLNSMQAENEKCSGESTSEVSANDADQVGGPRQFWQTTRVVTKNDSCLSFMTNDFRRTTSQLAVPRRPAVSTMRRPPGAAKHTGREDRNNEAQFKLCLECIGFSSFYLHPRWRRTSRCQKRCVLQHECCGGPRLDSAGKEPGRNHPYRHSECPRREFSGSPRAT